DKRFKVAAAQITPVFLNLDATIDKVCETIAHAADEGARLVVFPEALVPAYPDWVWAVPAGDGGVMGDLYSALLSNSVDIPGPVVDRLCRAAEAAGTFVVIGVNER